MTITKEQRERIRREAADVAEYSAIGTARVFARVFARRAIDLLAALEAAEAREATLREALEVVRTELPQHLEQHPDYHCGACTEGGSGVERYDECGGHAVLSSVAAALSSDGSPMLERVRELEAEITGLRYALAMAEAAEELATMEAEEASPSGRERLLRADIDDLTQANARLSGRVRELEAAVDKAHALLEEAVLAVEDAVLVAFDQYSDLSERIRAYLEGKGGEG